MENSQRKLKDIVNTPFKKAMFGVQLLSYILIPGSPAIGVFIGRWFGLSRLQSGGIILGIFIAGEILFYGSLAFLGKEVILLVKDKFKRKRKQSAE